MNPLAGTIKKLQDMIVAHPDVPEALKMRGFEQLARAALSMQYGGNGASFEIVEKYIEFMCQLPWNVESADNLDIAKAHQVIDSKHYGLPKVKERMMEYLASVILVKKENPRAIFRAPSLLFVGLAGTGKTTFAHIIAETLGRKSYLIPFGGLSQALDLRGYSKTSPYAQPGLILKALAHCGSRNPVIILDELDRGHGNDGAGIMGALLEILDHNQNATFTDYFLDYPFNLSQVMFIGTANNTREISTAVLDRMEIIEMPTYNDQEKIAIGKTYVLPREAQEAGLKLEQLIIDEDVWPKLVRPLGFEPGIRSLERLIESVVRKVALHIVSHDYDSVRITTENMYNYVDMTFASNS
ncbi:MAG TPA: AAA family ATPase [Candidatus Woesebacteria bacterium]|nr:AAA family ATPase [Candidatus Woesebacteria bacterium]